MIGATYVDELGRNTSRGLDTPQRRRDERSKYGACLEAEDHRASRLRRDESISCEAERRIEYRVAGLQPRRLYERVDLSLACAHQSQKSHPERGTIGASTADEVRACFAENEYRRILRGSDQLRNRAAPPHCRGQSETGRELLRLLETAARRSRDQASHARSVSTSRARLAAGDPQP